MCLTVLHLHIGISTMEVRSAGGSAPDEIHVIQSTTLVCGLPASQNHMGGGPCEQSR